MIICNYCDHYATNGYCNKCPYCSLLIADLHGELGMLSGKIEWTKEEAETELEKLKDVYK